MNQTVVRRGFAATALGFVLAVGAALSTSAQAGIFEGLLSSKPDLASSTQREWRIDEFTWVKLVDKEASTPANQHPATIDASALATQLAAVQTSARDGTEALFAEEELSGFVPVVARALSLAKPADDVLLLSTARRGGRLAAATGITARLFVQGDALNLVVNDTRLAFINDYRNSRMQPKFVYGSRVHEAKASLRSASAPSKRGDWVAIPVAGLMASSSAIAATTQAAPPAAGARPAPVAAAAVAPATVAPVTPAAPDSRAAIGEEIEQRLTTLKRLRDKNLISEEEYQQKRREVLQKL